MQTRENYNATQDEAETLMKKMLEDKSTRNIVRKPSSNCLRHILTHLTKEKSRSGVDQQNVHSPRIFIFNGKK